MLRPLPYPHPGRLVQLWQLDAKGQRSNFSDPNFQDVREQSQGFRAVSQFSQGTASAMVGTLPMRVRTASVSRDFFDVFGVEPALGRRFHEDESRVGATRVAIVDASFWLQHYGAAANLSSASLTVRGEPHTDRGNRRRAAVRVDPGRPVCRGGDTAGGPWCLWRAVLRGHAAPS